MLPEALIFDVDGTLAETEELHRQAFNRVFREAGLAWDWSPKLYAELLQTTGGKERMRAFVEQHAPADDAALDRLEAMHQAKTRAYLDLLAAGALELRPGVARLVHEARRRGVKLAIATTTTPQNVVALLSATLGVEAPGWFSISAGDVPGAKKPDPAVYLDALNKLAVAPERAVAFEDSSNGLRAAHAASLAVVATPSFYLAHEDLSGATAAVETLGEPDAPARAIAGFRFPRPWVDLDGLAAMLATR